MKCKLDSLSTCFSVNVCALPIVIRQFSKIDYFTQNYRFLKFTTEILQLAYKRPQKNIRKLCSTQKNNNNNNKKTLGTFQYLVKIILVSDLIFYKPIFFETLSIILEPTIKLFIRMFDLKQ